MKSSVPLNEGKGKCKKICRGTQQFTVRCLGNTITYNLTQCTLDMPFERSDCSGN